MRTGIDYVFEIFKIPENHNYRKTVLKLIEEIQSEAYNQAVKDCAKSATAYITQESVNGGKVAKVNSESILKNLKK